MGAYYFNPTTLTIYTGDRVEWITDGGYYSINFNYNSSFGLTGPAYNNPGGYDNIVGPAQPNPGTVFYSDIFNVAGTYNYDCNVTGHASNGMIGRLVVNSAPTWNCDVQGNCFDPGNGTGQYALLSTCQFLCSNTTSIEENINAISLYPNPTNENITISIENFNGNIQTEVFDLIGNKLLNTNETTISLQDYARGIYLLKVAYGDIVEEVKVIKD